MNFLPRRPHHDLDEPLEQPFRSAVMGSAFALLAVGLLELVYWLRLMYFRPGAEVYWWIWIALPIFAVVFCFTYCYTAAWFGGRWAAAFLKMMIGFVVAGMLAAVWWSVQPKGSGL